MTIFTSYTLENAPEGSKEKLAQVKAAWGFVPKLHGNLAESPVALKPTTRCSASSPSRR